MTTIEVISQIINGIGSTTNMIGINARDKRKILLFFIFGNAFVATSLGLLDARVGMLVQIIFVIETIINYFWERKYDKYPLWLIVLYVIIPCTVLAVTFQSVWDFLPIIASILFPLALLSQNLCLRILNLFSVVVWIPYNLHFGQYVGGISCLIFTIINIIAIVRLDILKKNENK